jgi:hypothetical protein
MLGTRAEGTVTRGSVWQSRRAPLGVSVGAARSRAAISTDQAHGSAHRKPGQVGSPICRNSDWKRGSSRTKAKSAHSPT